MLFLILQLRAGAAETNSVAAATNTPARGSFEAFRIIAQRNIFDPNRSARGTSRADDSGAKASKTEGFALVGTMLYEDRKFAFFDSSSSDYKKVLKVGETIAGYKIKDIEPSRVKLEADGNALELAVGQQLRREEEGQWELGGEAIVDTAGPTTGTAGGSSNDEEDEAVKRLMKKREEEMNR